MEKITRDKSKPAPGDYDTTTSWRNTQLGNKEFKISGAKKLNFTDVYKLNKKFIPGCGHYKYETKVYDRISISP